MEMFINVQGNIYECLLEMYGILPFSFSEVDKKLVVMDNFSEVVYFARILAFLHDQGSKDSS